jgi:hypothetical protein
MRSFGEFMGARVAFQPQLDIEHCADLELLPAFAANVDHAPIHTHPFLSVVVTSGRWQLHSFDSHVILLAVHICFQPRTVKPCLCPNAAFRYVTMSYPLKHGTRLLVWHQSTDPHHPSRQLWTIRRLVQPPSSVEGEKRPSDSLGNSSIRALDSLPRSP